MCLYLASENGGDDDDNDDDDEDDDDCLIVGGIVVYQYEEVQHTVRLCCVASGLPRSPHPYLKCRIETYRTLFAQAPMDGQAILPRRCSFFFFGETRLDEYQARWEVT